MFLNSKISPDFASYAAVIIRNISIETIRIRELKDINKAKILAFFLLAYNDIKGTEIKIRIGPKPKPS